MTWTLRDDHTVRHHKTGKLTPVTTWHKGFIAGVFPEGTLRESEAMTFRTKKAAETYNRARLRGRGYVPARTEAR